MKIDKEAKHRFDYVASAICDKYCKYPLIWNERRFGPLADSDVCEDCPLNQFEKYVEEVDETEAYKKGFLDGALSLTNVEYEYPFNEEGLIE